MSRKTREDVANLPDEGLELDDRYVAGILGRYVMARELLCVLLAKNDWTTVEQAGLQALSNLVEKDIPVLLKSL